MKSKRSAVLKIESQLGKPFESILQEYRENGLLVSEMVKDIYNKTCVAITDRSIRRWLVSLGISYTQSETFKKRWTSGSMTEAARKTRKTLRRAMLVGSKCEELLRWEIKEQFEKHKDYEAVVGFSNWSILDNLEIDIPVVVISKFDNQVWKFAIEVDGERYHTDERWFDKEKRIQQAGWQPIRVVIDNEMQRRAHQGYVKKSSPIAKARQVIAEINQRIKGK